VQAALPAVALDVPKIKTVKQIVMQIPRSNRVVLEAGMPLIKRYGTNVISDLRMARRGALVVVDLKTFDAGVVEVKIAYWNGAEAVVVAGRSSFKPFFALRRKKVVPI
jgi:bifunctional enzyme Fae/Hps